MRRYKTEAFSEAFARCGIKQNDVLFVHSSLFDLGIPEDIDLKSLPAVIYNKIKEVIGETGTLVVPTFNFEFCKGKPFDRQRTPSKNMGVFSEYIRTHPSAKRSFNPMQSVAVIGQHAAYLTENDTPSAFGVGSAFDRLIKLDAKVLNLGADFSYNSVFHWAEEKHEVPYRYWKEFKGSYTSQDETSIKTYKMYVRDLEANPEVNFNFLEKKLKNNGKLIDAKLGESGIMSYELSDFIALAETYIKQNPYFFIENHPEFENL